MYNVYLYLCTSYIKCIYNIYKYNKRVLYSHFSNQTISALCGVTFVFAKRSIRVNIVGGTVYGVESLNDPVAAG